ncbi:MAG TPA: SAM-dependent chlorinase/fluorinase [Desulfotignum sp.]|jgi:S-adenosyl-L-methionine hydrolase (adenosine-forming)|nr:SAM-dependent chlorinase/fluorinase [Desulfotignum sp.]
MPQPIDVRPIALLTDFGHTDPFAGVLKGVILSINPRASIVDLCHGVSPRDIAQGALMLETSLNYFPRGTIFCTVVDPGVGSSRRPVLVETEDYFLVGPDNGVLWPAAVKNTIRRVVHLTRFCYFLSPVSATFHGRDIFAPVAAHLSAGTDPSAFGPIVTDPVRLAPAHPKPCENGLILTVRHIDTFGNIGLNLTWERFESFAGQGFCMRVNQTEITGQYGTYAAAPDGQPFVLADSAGFVEIAVKNGHAASQLNVQKNDSVVLTARG